MNNITKIISAEKAEFEKFVDKLAPTGTEVIQTDAKSIRTHIDTLVAELLGGEI